MSFATLKVEMCRTVRIKSDPICGVTLFSLRTRRKKKIQNKIPIYDSMSVVICFKDMPACVFTHLNVCINPHVFFFFFIRHVLFNSNVRLTRPVCNKALIPIRCVVCV